MKDNDKTNITDEPTALMEGGDIAARPALTIDYAKYEHFLENADLTEEQKQEILQSLWTIICEFVWLGFGVHPAQQVHDACGKLARNLPKPAQTGVNAVEWRDQLLNRKFEDAADLKPDAAAKGVKI